MNNIIKEIEYNCNHIDLFNFENGNKEIYTDDEKVMMKYHTENSEEALTIMIDDIPICSIGFLRMNENTANIWLIKSSYLKKYKITIIKILKHHINFYAEKYKLKRIQTLITPENVKWIELLGLELESELENFQEKKTYFYRRLFKWE